MTTLAEPWMDDLETQLLAAASRVTGRLRARRRTRRIGALSLAAVLVVGGGSIAQTTTFHPLASFQDLTGAQREPTPDDAIVPPLRVAMMSHPGGLIEVDAARLMATLPGGDRLWASPGKDDTLCLVLSIGLGAGGVSACGPALGGDVPLMAVVYGGGPGEGPLLAGLARDDVRSVSFTADGAEQNVPVANNTFSFAGAPGTDIVFSLVAHLADGTAVTYPPGPGVTATEHSQLATG